MRPIDADALYRKVKAECNPYGKPSIGWEDGQRMMEWIEHAPTVVKDINVPTKWVSVKDRLPKDGQDVLAYLNDGEETRIAPCHYFNGVWFDSVMNCVAVLQDVTHWMPLPEPPKEG